MSNFMLERLMIRRDVIEYKMMYEHCFANVYEHTELDYEIDKIINTGKTIVSVNNYANTYQI